MDGEQVHEIFVSTGQFLEGSMSLSDTECSIKWPIFRSVPSILILYEKGGIYGVTAVHAQKKLMEHNETSYECFF
jgi:hypothetical protein